ncbi:hypothetical protein PFISCL1PPCAC_7737, partial [Pristionchus fissidentatus]
STMFLEFALFYLTADFYSGDHFENSILCDAFHLLNSYTQSLHPCLVMSLSVYCLVENRHYARKRSVIIIMAVLATLTVWSFTQYLF